MITRVGKFLRNIRRHFSRSEWAVRLLSLPRYEDSSSNQGLVIIQIDGLSKRQFKRACEQERMPFLNSLLKREDYCLNSLYSGLPSATPAVQAEIFYGKICAVPAFSFLNQSSNPHKIFSMLEPASASAMEKCLESSGKGVFKNGSVYSNIYRGGASEAQFCSSAIGWKNSVKKKKTLAFYLILLTHFWKLIRVVTLILLELIIAVGDCIKGLTAGHDFLKELIFIPTRVAICILLRELIVFGAQIDIARGVPVVQVNFLGYDEQSHRRGPSSLFAHWTLKGIDDAIQRLWNTANRSDLRDYDLWIYSDHGQEDVISYEKLHGKSVHTALNDLFSSKISMGNDGFSQGEKSIQNERFGWLGFPFGSKSARSLKIREGDTIPNSSKIIVTAKGPIGHVYPNSDLSRAEVESIARAIVNECEIPLVLVSESDSTARAWTAQGEFVLPEQAEEILGVDHPFLQEVAKDLVRLVNHSDAGRFVISGWRKHDKPLSFPIENGAHAGPGIHETYAFALLPTDIPLMPSDSSYARPIDLNRCIKQFLNPDNYHSADLRVYRHERKQTIRVMTYNVHSCIGIDGKPSPNRIARVIARYSPDIIALQELDVKRRRTEEVDQAHVIAKTLEMDFHFHPSLTVDEEKYGNAILSRFSSKVIKTGAFPLVPRQPNLEPRGLIWSEILVQGKKIQLINTHLGLKMVERRIQIESLAGSEWLGHPDCTRPLIVCGDFNTGPSSTLYQKLTRYLNDAQLSLNNHRPRKTWFGHYPISRIDHILISPELQVTNVLIPSTALTRKASDHLPLIVDLEFTE